MSDLTTELVKPSEQRSELATCQGPSRGRLTRTLECLGLGKVANWTHLKAVDREFLRLLDLGEKRAEEVTHFSVPLIPKFEHSALGYTARFYNLSVEYPTILLEDIYTPEQRAVLQHGYTGRRDLATRLLNTIWPNWIDKFRPRLNGEYDFQLASGECFSFDTGFLSIVPGHLWEMLRNPSLNYQPGVHHDASFGPKGLDTLRLVRKIHELYPAADVQELRRIIKSVFDPLQEQIYQLGTLVLDVAAVRNAIQERRAGQVLGEASQPSKKLPAFFS